MRVSLRELQESLQLTHELYEALIDLAKQKKDCIVQNQLNELTLVMAKESRLLKKMSEAEHARTQAILALQRALGISRGEPLTLTEVARMVTSPEDKTAIEGWIDRLLEQAAKLRELNDLNQALTRQALDFVELSLDLLTGVPEQAVYQAPSQTPAPTSRNGLYDFKA